jgi:hypothetical protein
MLISVGITLSIIERYHALWVLGLWLLLGSLLNLYYRFFKLC